MSYLAIKHLHISCVTLSISLFFLRGVWVLRDSPVMQQRWVKIVPHLIDTALLSSALTLAWVSQQWPFEQPGLTAKVVGLLLYVILGSIALKRGKTKAAKATAWVMALATFGYIVAVALMRSVQPWLP